MVFGLLQGKIRFLRQLGYDFRGKANHGIETRPSSCTPQGQFHQTGQGLFNTCPGQLHLTGVTTELLSQTYRGGILKMGAPDFDDVVKMRTLGLEFLLAGQQYW